MRSDRDIWEAVRDALSFPSHEHATRRLLSLAIEVLLDIRSNTMRERPCGCTGLCECNG